MRSKDIYRRPRGPFHINDDQELAKLPGVILRRLSRPVGGGPVTRRAEIRRLQHKLGFSVSVSKYC